MRRWGWMQPAGDVFADASWHSARRDKEVSETKNMQTTTLHASFTAHQTFIAWSHKRAVGTDDSWWLKCGGDRVEGRGRDRTCDRTGRVGRGGEVAAEELPTVYTYIMQMVPIISEVYNRSINLLTERKGSGELRVTTRGRGGREGGALPSPTLLCLVLTHLLTAGYTPP